jgi:transaldolase
MSYLKIFCDIADISAIKKFNKKSIVKGFTLLCSLTHHPETRGKIISDCAYSVPEKTFTGSSN